MNCQGNCAWDVWTDADGRITRENQSASYPAIAPDVPDANPRGCNKGVQQSQVLYQADRLLHPMRRTGARGEGKWKRISWDEAITEVATHLYETMLETGPAGNYVHMGSGMLSEARAASVKRLGTLLGAVRPYIASYVGDMFPGVSVVYGEGNLGCTYDFVYGSDVALFWGCNPNTSRIPDAHYLWEGKYRGAKIIVVTPEYNSSAIHADLWVPVKPGYDGHLALSIIQRLVATKRYSEPFLKQFTDLPLLVRTDTKAAGPPARHRPRRPALRPEERRALRRRPREAPRGLRGVGPEPEEGRGAAGLRGLDGRHPAPHRHRWKIDPALSGKYRIRLAGQGEVEVEPAFASFARELQAYAPEKTAKVTGVHPSVVEQLAKELSGSRVAIVNLGFAVGKHFNGMLSQRAVASLTAFLGKLGPFGGLATENEWSISGLEGLSGFAGKYTHRFASGFVSEFMLGNGFSDVDKAFDEADVKRATGSSRSRLRRPAEGAD